ILHSRKADTMIESPRRPGRRSSSTRLRRLALALPLCAVLSLELAACTSTAVGSSRAATRYAVDPYWPKDLPGNWQFGAVAGVAVDDRDHVWIIHRPGSFTDDERAASFDPPRAVCCVPAPSVVEFDAGGKVAALVGNVRQR